MKKIPLLPCLTLLLASVLVLVDGPAHAQSVPTYMGRLTRVLYDFDANGTTDAVDDISYDVGGRVMEASYVYTGDGVLDLLNTRDDSVVTEDGTFVFNADDLISSATADRGFESFSTMNTFAGDQLTRIDFASFDGAGAPVNEVYFLFTYTVGDLTQVQNFDTTTNDLINAISLTYGGDGLPQDVDLTSPGIGIDNTFTWRSDGQPSSISSVASGGNGTGSATFSYDAQGRPATEVWTQTGFVGSLFSEFPGQSYRKTFAYDALDRKILEEIDIDDDGSLEAILTFEWTEGACIPGFQWAPNGRPNFAASPYLPFVPGTGSFSLEYCPEPSFAFMIATGTVGIAFGSRRRRR